MEELKNTLIRVTFHNFGTKLVAVMVSLILWIVVLGSRNTEISKDIPVEVQTSENLVASNEIPEKVSFRLEGPKAFLRAILDRRDDPIRINLVGAKAGVQTYRFFSDNIHLPIGVKVLAIQPASVMIKLEPLKIKEVAIKAETQGHPAEGHVAGKLQIDPPKVRIRGPESRIDMLAELSALPVDISDAKRDVYKELQFETLRLGISLDGAPPRAHVVITGAQANIKLKNVEVSFISDGKYKASTKAIQVYVKGSEEWVQKAPKAGIKGVVNLKGLPKGEHMVPIEVRAPSELEIIKTVPEKMSVTVF